MGEGIASAIGGRDHSHRATVVHSDSPTIQGMIWAVRHLVKVEPAPEAYPAPVVRKPAFTLVAVLTLANISANVDQYILSLLVGPIKRDLGVSDVQVGLLLGAAFSVFYAVLGLPIARLADRANRRNLIAGGIALWSVFTSLCAVARTYASISLRTPERTRRAICEANVAGSVLLGKKLGLMVWGSRFCPSNDLASIMMRSCLAGFGLQARSDGNWWI